MLMYAKKTVDVPKEVLQPSLTFQLAGLTIVSDGHCTTLVMISLSLLFSKHILRTRIGITF